MAREHCGGTLLQVPVPLCRFALHCSPQLLLPQSCFFPTKAPLPSHLLDLPCVPSCFFSFVELLLCCLQGMPAPTGTGITGCRPDRRPACIALPAVLFYFFFTHAYAHMHEIAQLPPTSLALVAGVPPLLFALNVFWFGKIVQGALKLFLDPPKAKQKVRYS